jgi:methyltransferase-like protein
LINSPKQDNINKNGYMDYVKLRSFCIAKETTYRIGKKSKIEKQVIYLKTGQLFE